MTEKQINGKYWPARAEVCRRLGWRMAGGRLEWSETALNAHGRAVLTAATAAAAAEFRAPVLDDLRHAVHAVALGADKSSKKFSNRDLDRYLAYTRLMWEETNIAADIWLDYPEIKAREALVAGIQRQRIPLAIIEEVCRRSFRPVYQSPHWDLLPLPNLRALAGILREEKEKYLAEYVN